MDRRTAEDPELTAYALGELEGEAWAAAEQRVATDPTARKYVEEVRAAARVMTDSLGDEVQSAPALEQNNRERIDEHLHLRTRSIYGPGRGRQWGLRPALWVFAAVAMFA
ncbi:MAG: hypothetical protein ACREIT_04805, partial [Tepidisphaeraceae bacterium]